MAEGRDAKSKIGVPVLVMVVVVMVVVVEWEGGAREILRRDKRSHHSIER
jgi:hypothetical protein